MLNKLSVTCVSMDSATVDDASPSPSFVPPRLPPIISILSGALDNDALDIIPAATRYIQKTPELPANIGTQLIRSNTAKGLGHCGDNGDRLVYITFSLHYRRTPRTANFHVKRVDYVKASMVAQHANTIILLTMNLPVQSPVLVKHFEKYPTMTKDL